MALCTVQQLERRTVRVHPVQVHLIIVASVIPAREHDLAIAHWRWVKIMTLVESELLNAAAIIVHDVDTERKLVLVFVHRREAGLAFVQQDGLRTRLTGRREN